VIFSKENINFQEEAAAPVIEKPEEIKEAKLFGNAIPSPSGSQSKSLFSSNIKTDGGMPKAGLFGNLMDNKTGASIFGGNNKTPATEVVPEKAPQTIQVQEQEKPKGGLFGNLSSQPKTETAAPLFGNQQQQQPKTDRVIEEKPKSIFGGITSSSQPSSGLFGSSLSSQPKPEVTQAPAEKPKSIFGGLTSKAETTSITVEPEKPKGGLFSGMVSSQPKAETTTSMTVEPEKPKGGLFSGMATSQPKVEQTPAPVQSTGNLFGSSTPVGGLFGNQPKPETAAEKPKSIFGGLTSNQPKTETTSMTVEPEKPKGGLFSGISTQPKTETPAPMTVEPEKPKGGLFSGMATSQPKVESTPAPVQSTGSLFGSQPKPEATPAPIQTQAEKPKSIFGGLTSSQPKTDSPTRSLQPSSLGSFGGHSPATATQQKKETASPPSKINDNFVIINGQIEPSGESAVKTEASKPGLFSGMASTKPASFLGSVNRNILIERREY